MAVYRFVARSGSPFEVHSDNGTKFQAANRELRDQIEAIGRDLTELFTNSISKKSGSSTHLRHHNLVDHGSVY